METVLVVRATGNIGVAAVQATLRSRRNVLAIVRHEASASRLFENVGTKNGTTTVEADILSDDGVQTVVDQVRIGRLPVFQHVYSAAGGAYGGIPLQDLDKDELSKFMNINFESNFCSQGDIGARAAPAITQGSLVSIANVAYRDDAQTNIRFNEVYLAARVEIDSIASVSGSMKWSDSRACTKRSFPGQRSRDVVSPWAGKRI